MPRWLQVLSALVPGRYYIQILRGVMLKGNGLDVLGGPLLALAAFAVGVVGLAVVKFRRSLG
jgi:ABC-2 type transport system permease protein